MNNASQPNKIPFDDFTGSFFNFSLGVEILLLVKFLLLVGLLLYIAFAVIVVRQVNLMTKTLNGSFNPTLKLVSWLHLIVALGVFLFAMTIL